MIKSISTIFIMTAASITDIRKRSFPLIYQIMLLCLVPIGFKTEYLIGAVLAVPFFIVCVRAGKFGGGDYKAVALLGFLSGFFQTLFSVIAGCLGFIIFGLITEWIKGEEQTFPFIPFLSAGYIIFELMEVL